MLEDIDELVVQHAKLEKALFDLSLQIKEVTSPLAHLATEARGVRLLYLDVPTFNGSLLNWGTIHCLST